MITKKLIYQVLNNEIEWCKNNTGFLPAEEEIAFIKGIKQSICIIKNMK